MANAEMNAPVTRGEMEQALQPLRAAITHLTDEMGAMERRLERRLESQIQQHINAAVEQIRTFILGLDDKYKDLPARVTKLEELPKRVQRLEDKVFAPKRKRR